MAEVYDAIDERLDRPVAVKVLRPTMALRPDVRRRFEAEARSAARLSHPNAVAVFDTGEDGDVPWLVMERLPGETLADRMREAGGPLDAEWVRRMAGDVLGALGAAHAAGLIHRDVKPGNILLDGDGCAKVADFGIAKSIESTDDHTATGQLIGTPAYLAPERILGEPANVRTDLYALGVVLYEALSGRKPFEGSTPITVAHAIRTTTPPPLAELRPELDAPVVAAVEGAMHRDPSQRFASAAEMAAALQSGMGGSEDDDDGTVLGMAAAAVDATMIVERPADAEPIPLRALVPVPRARARVPARAIAIALVALLVVLLLGVLLASGAGSGGGGGGELEADLRDASADTTTADGTAGPDAAGRLRALADAVGEGEEGDDADAANALLTDLANWRASGGLTAAAADRMRAVVLRAPGASAAAYSPTSTTPTTVVPAARDTGDDRRGGGKKKDDDD